MKESNTGKRVGLSMPSVLTLIFIILKVAGVINWSWLWVLSPIWLSVALYLFLLMFFLFAALAIMIAAEYMEDKDI